MQSRQALLKPSFIQSIHRGSYYLIVQTQSWRMQINKLNINNFSHSDYYIISIELIHLHHHWQCNPANNHPTEFAHLSQWSDHYRSRLIPILITGIKVGKRIGNYPAHLINTKRSFANLYPTQNVFYQPAIMTITYFATQLKEIRASFADNGPPKFSPLPSNLESVAASRNRHLINPSQMNPASLRSKMQE